MSEQELQTRGYKWWQWVLGVVAFLPLFPMLVGKFVPNTRRVLSPTQIWVGYGLVVLGFVIGMAAASGGDEASPRAIAPAPSMNQQRVSVPAPTPVSKFHCRDLELEYQNVVGMIGHNMALQAVANHMNLRDPQTFSMYGLGDAERELQRCGVVQ